MTVKILLLKSGEDVIADLKEMVSPDEKVIGYFLTKPCVVKLIPKDLNNTYDNILAILIEYFGNNIIKITIGGANSISTMSVLR